LYSLEYALKVGEYAMLPHSYLKEYRHLGSQNNDTELVTHQSRTGGGKRWGFLVRWYHRWYCW